MNEILSLILRMVGMVNNNLHSNLSIRKKKSNSNKKSIKSN